MEKQRKIVLGCALGCLIPVVLLIGSCVGFQRWLQAPVPVLEPQQLLDERAVGYVEWRMELENPGTERFFDAGVDLFEVQARQMPSVPIFDLFVRWNQRRQEKKLRRLFPATGSWMLYPHGFRSKGSTADSRPDDLGQLFSLSVSRMGNQLRLADWLMGLTLSRAAEEAVVGYRGERIYVFGPSGDSVVLEEPEPGLEIEIDRDREGEIVAREESELSGPVHVFLRREGVFLATEEAVALRTIDQLQDGSGGTSRSATELERLFASVPEHYQLRGAVLNENGELNEMLDTLVFAHLYEDLESADPEDAGDSGDVETDWKTDVRPAVTNDELVALQNQLLEARSMVIGGAIAADGSSELDLTFAPRAGQASTWAAELGEKLQSFGRTAAERSSERGFALESVVTPALGSGGVTWRLRFADLAGDIEREVESVSESVMSEVRREIERGPRVKPVHEGDDEVGGE